MAYERVPEWKIKNPAYALSSLALLLGAAACQTTSSPEQSTAPDRALYDHVGHSELIPTEKSERRIPYESIPEYLKREGRQDALREYWRGVHNLQRSAHEDTEEIMRAFLIHRDGSFEWVASELTKVAVDDERPSNGEFVYSVPKRFISDLLFRVENGGRVIIFHTHPSHLFRDIQKGNPDALRVPPSPTDMYSALLNMKQLHPDAFERLNFSVVTENRLWRYGFSTQEALDRFSVAMSVGAKLLENEENEEIKNQALLLEKTLADVFASTKTGENASVEWQVNAILKSDHLSKEIKENPRLLLHLSLVKPTFESLGLPIPEDAHELLELFNKVHNAVQKELLGSDPHTDGNFSQPPMLGNFPKYTARWQGIGAVMEEVPLPPIDFF